MKTQQNEWKRHRWIKVKTKLLRRGLDGQYDLVMRLPDEAHGWDVTLSMIEMINELIVCGVFCYRMFLYCIIVCIVFVISHLQKINFMFCFIVLTGHLLMVTFKAQ